ncbi:MAG: cobalamin B12-binding domain-containing protein [Deltaproteobacteria bacterium]|nr:cobalamin B12-binding domain-containing protein [Deltaproteobacteria bacterium]
MEKDLKKLRPYGDHLDDGKVQISFTLPIPPSDEAKEAARCYLEKLGLRYSLIACMEPMGEGFSFFVGYGYAEPTVDFTAIKVPKPEFPLLSRDELLTLAREKIGRQIVVVGGTTGSDAHTVGIDAILSMKGIHGDKGLEYYPCFKVINLRAQVSNSVLIEKAVAAKADAILVSKLVTQQDQHLKDLKELLDLLREETRLPVYLLKIVGGPRMDHKIARQVGYDAGFGGGTKPSEVASYIVHELVKRMNHEGKERVEGQDKAPPKKKGRSLLGWLGGGGEGS